MLKCNQETKLRLALTVVSLLEQHNTPHVHPTLVFFVLFIFKCLVVKRLVAPLELTAYTMSHKFVLPTKTHLKQKVGQVSHSFKILCVRNSLSQLPCLHQA